MRIAVCTLTGKPDDVNVWSGTPAHFLQGLRAIHDDVVTIGPLIPKVYWTLNNFSNLTGRFSRKLNWEVEPLALKQFTKAFDRELTELRPDVAILMGWVPWESDSHIPLIYWGDATVGQRLDKSPHWSNLSARTKSNAERVEGESLQKLNAVLMPSKWAADDTASRYGVQNAFVAPFGANIEDPGAVKRSAPKAATVKLLSVGVKWDRKGMDTAVMIADVLNRAEVNAHLDIVGVKPPDESWRRDYVTYHGFLSKTNEPEKALLDNLYRSADLFLMPTRNDPFPMVLAEAAAYGLPVVASDVGGVPDRVEDGVAGVLLAHESDASEYADAVMRVVSDPRVYDGMSSSARARYETHFTWERCAENVVSIAADVMGRVTIRP